MITDLQEFKTAKAVNKAKPIVSRQRAVIAAGTLLTALADCERNDILAALRFDMTPDDLLALETFTFHLNHRIEDRVNGYDYRKQRGKGTSDQQPA